jgi:Cu(I)/Ag(I) efflux system membrane fusion protein
MTREPSPDPAPSVAAEPPLTRGQKLRMLIKVVELRLRFLILLAGTGLVFGYWDTIWNHYDKWTRPTGAGVLAAASTSEYFCPMHPNVVRAEASTCPICGMPLSKRARGEKAVLPEGVTARVALSPLRVGQAGVRTIEVSYAPLVETLTTVGNVAFDESRLARIASRIPGNSRVERLHVNITGAPVRAGEPLAELYSPELAQAVRELVLATRNASTSRPATAPGRSLLGETTNLVALTREKLTHWGLTDAQLDQIVASGQAETRMAILSPRSGVVIRKNVVAGQVVAEGESLFEVADLGHVWVQAAVFEDQIGKVQVGQAVEASVDAYPGSSFRGTVAFIDPALDPATRTVNVRYDLDNPDGRLLPGMFARVTLRTPVAQMPAFRERLARRSAATAMGITRFATAGEQEICPVTRARLGSMGEPLPVKLDTGQVWICCEGCGDKLRREPRRYLAALQPAPADSVLTVPESAVIDTGTRRIVYIETDPGTFEGRQVVLGPRSGDLYTVLDGLAPGDRVATAGAFLIDAETRLNPGAASTYVGATGSGTAP